MATRTLQTAKDGLHMSSKPQWTTCIGKFLPNIFIFSVQSVRHEHLLTADMIPYRFWNINCKMPGCVHDANVLRQSTLFSQAHVLAKVSPTTLSRCLIEHIA